MVELLPGSKLVTVILPLLLIEAEALFVPVMLQAYNGEKLVISTSKPSSVFVIAENIGLSAPPSVSVTVWVAEVRPGLLKVIVIGRFGTATRPLSVNVTIPEAAVRAVKPEIRPSLFALNVTILVESEVTTFPALSRISSLG
jgi:hypothetical protein